VHDEATGLKPLEATGLKPLEATGLKPLEATGLTPLEVIGLKPLEVIGLTPLELGALMPRDGRPSPTRGKALWRWLREEADVPATTWPESLPELGRNALSELQRHVALPDVVIEERYVSRDGTIKWRLTCRGRPIETVMIPTATRATVCVSSQSGCTRWCDFCATARMSFGGQLSAGEIVAQVLLARRAATVPLTNVVFMGMGEPLDNFEAVLTAVRVLDEGVGIAPKHCTVSTSGVLPRMIDLWERSRASLALSLHATTQELRDRLMPRVKRWPLAALCEWMRAASEAPLNGAKPRHFFIEYAMLRGINDSDADADRLVALMAGIRARINLIPFNASDGLPYGRPDAERIRAFQHRVIAGGLLTIVRETRGDDAAAACGQLAVGRAG